MTTPNSSTPVQRYHPALMALHWLMALMIIALLLGGSLVTAPTPNTDPEKIGHIKGHIRHVQEVVGEVFFDNVALIPAANYKVVYAMRGVAFHYVPEKWFATNFDHGFWFEVSFL